MAWSDAARAAAVLARRRRADAQRRVPQTVGGNRAQMDAMLASSPRLKARISAATVSAMIERERLAPSSELYGRPKFAPTVGQQFRAKAAFRHTPQRIAMAKALREQRALRLLGNRGLSRSSIRAVNDHARWAAKKSLTPVKGRDY